MKTENVQIGFFIFLIVASFALVFFVFKPYLSVIFLAIITAIIFEPIHARLEKLFRGKKTVAALVSVSFVVIVVLVPLLFLGVLLFQESVDFYNRLADGGPTGLLDSLTMVVDNTVAKIFPNATLNVSSYFDIEQYARQGVTWLSDHLTSFFSGLAKGVLGIFILLLGLFYVFRDGRSLLQSTITLSPLLDNYDETIVKKIHLAVKSVIRGQLLVGLIQGILTGVGFALFGVPNPVIWGSIAAIASLIPSIGTGLVAGPAILYLLFGGQTVQAIGLLLWSLFAVGLVDNVLGPILIQRGVKIHPFLILLSVLGGLSFFGPVGFMAGPVILSLCIVLLEIYPLVIKKSRNTIE